MTSTAASELVDMLVAEPCSRCGADGKLVIRCSACDWRRVACGLHTKAVTFSRGVRVEYSALDKAFAGHANVHRPPKLRRASIRQGARAVSKTMQRKAEERRQRAARGRL